MAGTRGASETDGNGAGLGRVWLLDVASAACWTAVVAGLLVAQGGIWEYVNSGDLHAQFLPWYEYAGRAVLREGRLPFWGPEPQCGTPILALAQSAALYPPVIVLFGLLPSWAALQALYACHVLLLAWGMAAYLRRHHVRRAAAGLGSLLAVAGVFRGPMLAGVDHPNFLGSAAWVPWVLLFWERAIDERAPRWTACAAVAIAAQWLVCYPDFSLDLPVLLGVMALVSDRGSLGRRVGTALAGLLLGWSLAAIQLVPLAEAIGESARMDADYPYDFFRSVFAVHSPAHLVHVLMARFGPASLALALLGLWPPGRARLSWLATFVWATFALNLPFRLLYLVPPYSSIRFPFGWSGSSGVFLGSLVAAGLTAAWRGPQLWRRALAVALGVAAAGHGIVVVARAPGSVPPFDPRGSAWRAPDMALAGARATVLRELVTPYDRVVSEREAASGSALRYDIAIVNGTFPSLPPRRIVALLEELDIHNDRAMLLLYRGIGHPGLAHNPDLGALLGVGVVAVPRRKAGPLLAAGFAQVGTLPPDDLLLHRPAVPRARLVHRVIEATGEEGTLAAVLASARDAAHVAVVETGALHAPLDESAASAREEVRIVRYEPEHVVIETTVAAPALLVLTDTFYPGWHATVDGAPATILRTDHAFRGVRLEPGRHRISFRYLPGSVLLGAVISLAAAVIAVLCFASRPRPHVAGSGDAS